MLTAATREAIIAARTAGATYRECAAIGGCSLASVHRILTAVGLTGSTIEERRTAVLTRLRARLDAVPVGPDGCAMWTGRPFFTVPPALRDLPEWATGATSTPMRIGRAALILHHGWQPGRAGHTCGRSLCVHPDHLTWT